MINGITFGTMALSFVMLMAETMSQLLVSYDPDIEISMFFYVKVFRTQRAFTSPRLLASMSDIQA